MLTSRLHFQSHGRSPCDETKLSLIIVSNETQIFLLSSLHPSHYGNWAIRLITYYTLADIS